MGGGGGEEAKAFLADLVGVKSRTQLAGVEHHGAQFRILDNGIGDRLTGSEQVNE